MQPIYSITRHLVEQIAADFPNIDALNLSHNKISRIQNLQTLTQLTLLDLSHNCITTVENLDGLCHLQHLDMSHNAVTAVNSSLANLHNLQHLDISHNQLPVEDALVSQLASLSALTSLNITGNPCCASNGFTESILQALPQLQLLDGQQVQQQQQHHQLCNGQRVQQLQQQQQLQLLDGQQQQHQQLQVIDVHQVQQPQHHLGNTQQVHQQQHHLLAEGCAMGMQQQPERADSWTGSRQEALRLQQQQQHGRVEQQLPLHNDTETQRLSSQRQQQLEGTQAVATQLCAPSESAHWNDAACIAANSMQSAVTSLKQVTAGAVTATVSESAASTKEVAVGTAAAEAVGFAQEMPTPANAAAAAGLSDSAALVHPCMLRIPAAGDLPPPPPAAAAAQQGPEQYHTAVLLGECSFDSWEAAGSGGDAVVAAAAAAAVDMLHGSSIVAAAGPTSPVHDGTEQVKSLHNPKQQQEQQPQQQMLQDRDQDTNKASVRSTLNQTGIETPDPSLATCVAVDIASCGAPHPRASCKPAESSNLQRQQILDLQLQIAAQRDLLNLQHEELLQLTLALQAAKGQPLSPAVNSSSKAGHLSSSSSTDGSAGDRAGNHVQLKAHCQVWHINSLFDTDGQAAAAAAARPIVAAVAGRSICGASGHDWDVEDPCASLSGDTGSIQVFSPERELQTAAAAKTAAAAQSVMCQHIYRWQLQLLRCLLEKHASAMELQSSQQAAEQQQQQQQHQQQCAELEHQLSELHAQLEAEQQQWQQQYATLQEQQAAERQRWQQEQQQLQDRQYDLQQRYDSLQQGIDQEHRQWWQELQQQKAVYDDREQQWQQQVQQQKASYDSTEQQWQQQVGDLQHQLGLTLQQQQQWQEQAKQQKASYDSMEQQCQQQVEDIQQQLGLSLQQKQQWQQQLAALGGELQLAEQTLCDQQQLQQQHVQDVRLQLDVAEQQRSHLQQRLQQQTSQQAEEVDQLQAKLHECEDRLLFTVAELEAAQALCQQQQQELAQLQHHQQHQQKAQHQQQQQQEAIGTLKQQMCELQQQLAEQQTVAAIEASEWQQQQQQSQQQQHQHENFVNDVQQQQQVKALCLQAAAASCSLSPPPLSAAAASAAAAAAGNHSNPWQQQHDPYVPESNVVLDVVQHEQHTLQHSGVDVHLVRAAAAAAADMSAQQDVPARLKNATHNAAYAAPGIGFPLHPTRSRGATPAIAVTTISHCRTLSSDEKVLDMQLISGQADAAERDQLQQQQQQQALKHMGHSSNMIAMKVTSHNQSAVPAAKEQAPQTRSAPEQLGSDYRDGPMPTMGYQHDVGCGVGTEVYDKLDVVNDSLLARLDQLELLTAELLLN